MTAIPQHSPLRGDAIDRAVAGIIANKTLAAFDRDTERKNAAAHAAYEDGDLRAMMRLRMLHLARIAVVRPLMAALKEASHD